MYRTVKAKPNRVRSAHTAGQGCGHAAPQHRVLQLQRSVGNQATIQLMRTSMIQRAPSTGGAGGTASRLHPQVIAAFQDPLLSIITDPVRSNNFRNFLDTVERNTEYFPFLNAVTTYLDHGGNSNTVARGIYNRFIKRGAPFELNISDKQRRVVEDALQQQICDPNTFSGIVQQVALDMGDPASRFIMKEQDEAAAEQSSAPAKKKGFFSKLFGL